MLRKFILLLITFNATFIEAETKEVTCIINGKKTLHTVKEEFLSFSVDPATLLAGSNISSTSLLLAKHLSPAFIRLSGPSTEFIQFSEKENIAGSSLPSDGKSLFVTPQVWRSFSYWIKSVNLTPIFAINDNKVNGIWDPKTIVPFLNMNEEMGFSSYWQLGHDCGYKSLSQYKEDLKALRHVLDDYPSTKVVGSNFASCVVGRGSETVRKTFADLGGVADAVVWESTNRLHIPLSPPHLTKSYLPVWLIIPKSDGPVTFSSGLLWAKQIGEAAKDGYEVIFREPRFHELFTDTPVFWISLIHKSLMGRNVLDVKTNSLPVPGAAIYAHCTKRQNQYSRQGAMTVFVVNSGNYEFTASLRVASTHPKSIDVHSYIMTANKEDSTETYLNGQKLTINILKNDRLLFSPTLRRIKVDKLLNLNLPAKSVGFFVLPGARIPVCIDKEDDTYLLMDEFEDQKDFLVNSKEDTQLRKGLMGLSKLFNLLPQESEPDQEVYTKTENMLSNALKKSLLEHPINPSKISKPKDVVGNSLTTKDFRQYLLSRTKAPEWQPKEEKTTKLMGVSKLFNLLPQESEPDQEFYTKTDNMLLNALKKSLLEISINPSKISKPKDVVGNSLTTKDFRQYLLSRTKAPEWQPKEEKTTKLEIIFTERPASSYSSSNRSKQIELQLTNDEIKNILTNRAKSRAKEVNIDVTSAELENLMTKATDNFISRESTTSSTHPKRERIVTFRSLKRRENEGPAKRRFRNRKREKRDINMEMLRRNTQQEKTSRPKSRQGVKKPVRNFFQGSEESFRDAHESSEARSIFAELARSWGGEDSQDFHDFHSDGFDNYGSRSHFDNMDELPVDDLHSGERFLDERIRFLKGPVAEDFTRDEGMSGYHTFHENLERDQFMNPKSRVYSELWKMERARGNNDKSSTNDVRKFLSDLSSKKGKYDFNKDVEVITNPRFAEEDEFDSRFDWENMDQPRMRFKRDANITKSDIKNFKKFMVDQLQTLKVRRNDDGNKRNGIEAKGRKSNEAGRSRTEKAKRKNEEGIRRKNEEGRRKSQEGSKRRNDVWNKRKNEGWNKGKNEVGSRNQEWRRRKDEEKHKKNSGVKSKTSLLDQKEDNEGLFSKGQHLHIVIGKPYDPEKVQIDERKRESQVRYLKQRLQNRKKLNEKAREKHKEQNPIAEGAGASRRKRMSSPKSNVYIPKVRHSNNAAKRYARKSIQKKLWQPQDLRKIKRTPSYSVEDLNSREFFHREAPFLTNEVRKNRRLKRKVSDEIDVAINEIEDDSSNLILKPKGLSEGSKNIFSQSTATTKNRRLTSIGVVDNENATMTSNKSLEQSTESLKAVTTNSSIDYCTSNYKKTTTAKGNETNSSTKAQNDGNISHTHVIDDIVNFASTFFEGIFNKVSLFMVN